MKIVMLKEYYSDDGTHILKKGTVCNVVGMIPCDNSVLTAVRPEKEIGDKYWAVSRKDFKKLKDLANNTIPILTY